MTFYRLSVLFYVVVATMLLGQTLIHQPQLPERVATHFDGAGRADGWSPRDAYLRTTWSMQGLLVLLFPALVVVVRKAPPRFIGLPRRDRWLTPERAAATRRELACWVLGFGAAMLLYVVFLQHQTLRVNLGEAETIAHMWTALAVYLAATLGGTALMILRFART